MNRRSSRKWLTHTVYATRRWLGDSTSFYRNMNYLETNIKDCSYHLLVFKLDSIEPAGGRRVDGG